MSLFGAMLTAVGGLQANSSALSVTSSNIANVNTTGYKDSTTAFSTLVAQISGGGNTAGVKATTVQHVSNQGLLNATSNDTDLGINDGDGFFICSTLPSNTANVEYTRAGDFTTNKEGYLVNSANLYLLGYSLDASGAGASSQSLGPINLKNIAGIAEATSKATLTGNLESTTKGDGVTADYSTPLDIYDSQGGVRTFKISFTKSTSTANTWSYSIDYTGAAADLTGGVTNVDTGTITFNTDGSLKTVTSTKGTIDPSSNSTAGTVKLPISWSASAGVGNQSVSFDFGTIGGTDGFTQYATASTSTNKVNGAVYGDVSDVSIGSDGIITATYTNGLTKDIYQIPLAIFANPDGLKSTSGTAYTTTDASGNATITSAGSNGAGTILSKELEDSTVDLATELTDLITTQRAYSACAKIVTTSTNMLDVLVNMGN
jgi:flagellar hook protein FlgE